MDERLDRDPHNVCARSTPLNRSHDWAQYVEPETRYQGRNPTSLCMYTFMFTLYFIPTQRRPDDVELHVIGAEWVSEWVTPATLDRAHAGWMWIHVTTMSRIRYRLADNITVGLYLLTTAVNVVATSRWLAGFVAHDTCGRGSVLLWRHWHTLCISGFVDDVMFARNGQE